MNSDDNSPAVQRLAVLVAAVLADPLGRIEVSPPPSPELVEQVVQIFGPTLDALVHKAARPGDSATARRPRRDAASGGYLSVAQLATHLGRSPRWVKDRVRPGAKERLPHRRVSANRPPDFSPEHVAWIDRHYSVAASAAPEQVLAGLDPTLRARSRRALAVTPKSTQDGTEAAS
ncbi:MAG TPA: hypothetical protein VGX23_33750 [Actinocrinis sp.]|nr:hypothetical protein [Actinocrinis sp.]